MIIQLFCCGLLLLLNNWQLVVVSLDRFRTFKKYPGDQLKRTLSTLDFMRKKEHERARFKELASFVENRLKRSSEGQLESKSEEFSFRLENLNDSAEEQKISMVGLDVVFIPFMNASSSTPGSQVASRKSSFCKI